jgi:hypothetical protein
MGRPNLARGIAVSLSLAGALSLRRLGRTYGNLASHLDERRAEDEFDANMGRRQGVGHPTSRDVAISATSDSRCVAAQPEDSCGEHLPSIRRIAAAKMNH